MENLEGKGRNMGPRDEDKDVSEREAILRAGENPRELLNALDHNDAYVHPPEDTESSREQSEHNEDSESL